MADNHRRTTADRVAILIGTGLGLGLMPVAPGTFGSLLGPPLAWAIQQADQGGFLYWVLSLVVVLAGIPVATRLEDVFGKKGSGSVVIDEIAAFPVVFAAVPVSSLTTALAGFLWFRLFDIAKPWPIRRLEQLPSGLGVMADDVAAGAYAAVALWLTVRFTPI